MRSHQLRTSDVLFAIQCHAQRKPVTWTMRHNFYSINAQCPFRDGLAIDVKNCSHVPTGDAYDCACGRRKFKIPTVGIMKISSLLGFVIEITTHMKALINILQYRIVGITWFLIEITLLAWSVPTVICHSSKICVAWTGFVQSGKLAASHTFLVQGWE